MQFVAESRIYFLTLTNCNFQNPDLNDQILLNCIVNKENHYIYSLSTHYRLTHVHYIYVLGFQICCKKLNLNQNAELLPNFYETPIAQLELDVTPSVDVPPSVDVIPYLHNYLVTVGSSIVVTTGSRNNANLAG